VKLPSAMASIVSGFGLLLFGCDLPEEGAQHIEKPASHSIKPGPAAPKAPIEPSPVPSLPETPRGDLDKKDEPRPEAKKDDGKAEVKAEPRLESPKP